MPHAIKTICALCLVALPAQTLLADVYKYRDAQGRIYLTDTPMKGGYRLLKRFSIPGSTPSRPTGTLRQMFERRDRLAPLIQSAATRNNLPEGLVHAVVRAESAYRTDAVSPKGAMGLMQLMPGTAKRFGVSDAFNPQQNLDGGSRYLSLLLEQFNQDLRLALAAYNAGENAVIRYGNKIPPFPETQNYVKKVIAFYNQHQPGADDRLAQR